MVLGRVRRTIRERALLARGARVLVACSGGPDSAVLLHVLARLRTELGVGLCAASVDHGLRPEAARDVEIARVLATGLDVPFVALKVELPRLGASVQDKARRARYGALRAEAARQNAAYVAVGHTRDDQAETVLGRILRGGGARSLGGIAPRRADGVIRPLLDCRRADVHGYALRHALPFVRDPSNESEAFTRARLRSRVIPVLLEEDPRVVEHLAALADDARALRELVERAASELSALADRGDGALAIEPLRAAPAAVRVEVLARWVEARAGVPAARAHLSGLERSLLGRGEVLLPGGLRARVTDGLLVARRAPDESVRGRPRPRP